MKKLGKFTKTIYGEDYDFSQCPECCVMLTDEQANDETFIDQHHLEDLKDCIKCFGCPAAQKSKV